MKRFTSILLIMLLAISLVGCNNQNQNNESAPVSYREELESIINKEKGKEFYYDGINQNYSHIVHVTEIEKKPELTIVKMDGVLMNTIEESELAQRNFNVQYVIDNNSIRENIQNYDIHKTDGNAETVNSIIPNQVILQGPLEEGNLWFQKFNYNGKEYTAKTTLTTVSKNQENKKIYKTETAVEDIKGFLNNTYTETRTYEEGNGLVAFQNNQPVIVENNKSKEKPVFRYTLSSIRKIENNK